MEGGVEGIISSNPFDRNYEEEEEEEEEGHIAWLWKKNESLVIRETSLEARMKAVAAAFNAIDDHA